MNLAVAAIGPTTSAQEVELYGATPSEVAGANPTTAAQEAEAELIAYAEAQCEAPPKLMLRRKWLMFPHKLKQTPKQPPELILSPG